MEIRFKLVWFDSFGAKSSCILVENSSASVLVDPGVAIMHGTFPAPFEAKRRWCAEGFQSILKASAEAGVVVVTHYHYDHFTDFDERLYRGKIVLAKNPNVFINDSQRSRALSFYRHLFSLGGVSLEEVLEEPEEFKPVDPLSEIPEAMSRSFGNYDSRRSELLAKGMDWFKRRAEKWSRYRRIPELKLPNIEVRFADHREFRFGKLVLRFTKPLFHGIEFSRVGWVLGLTLEHDGWKLLYSSDLNGPIIEDYANWIVDEKPNVLILDGPMTYMLGYTLNRINLGRALDNAIRIVKQSGARLIVYDHHLPREPRFRERTKPVWEAAEGENVKLTTAAECLGYTPAVLRYENWKGRK